MIFFIGQKVLKGYEKEKHFPDGRRPISSALLLKLYHAYIFIYFFGGEGE